MKNTFYVQLKEDNIENLKQFIRASLLGDGSIPKLSKNAKNYRMTFGHSLKQECYLNWKHSYLKQYELEGKITLRTAISSRYKNGFCKSLHFKSKAHPIFTEFRNLYYKDGKKIVNKDDISKLNELGLSIWFMDDGYINKPKNKSSFAILCTTSFTKDEVNFLIDLLRNKWDFECSYYSSENGIRFTVKSTIKLITMIKKFIVKCLDYKMVLYKQGELLEILQIEKDNQQPSLSSNTLEGSTTNNQILPDKAEDSNVDTSALQSFINDQKDLKSDFKKVIDENFWDLI